MPIWLLFGSDYATLKLSWIHKNCTYRTKLKLDKKVGGGNLFDLCTITYLIAYPFACTVYFKNCIDVQLTIHQPRIPKTSQAAAWSHRYIGYWMDKTEGSLIGFMANFWRLNDWKIPLPKVVEFEPLGACFCPGAPDADLAPFRKRFYKLQTIMNSQKPYFYNADRPLRCHDQCMSTPKPL